MHYDELISELGEFGSYQRRIYFLLCISTMVLGWHDLIMVFLGATPEFRCVSSDLKLTGPKFKNETNSGQLEFVEQFDSSCYRYVLDMPVNHSLEQADHYLVNTSYKLESCHDRYVFSKSEYTETIVSEFHLVCDKKFWAQLLKSIFFAGGLIGSVIFGQISDRYGRKPSLLSAFLILFISGTAASVAPDMYIFLVMYFFQGAANTGALIIAITLSTELVGLKYRVPVGIIVQSFHSIGLITLSGIAYLIREWRYLEMAITFPVIFTILYWWFLPESIPWLLSQGRKDVIESCILTVAKENGVFKDSDDVVKYLKDTPTTKTDKTYYVTDCVRTWKMAKISLNVWFNWLVTTLVFYGLSLYTEHMPGNHYLMFGIVVAVDIPADIVSIILSNSMGRRKPLMLSLVLAGVACILSEYLPNNTATTVRMALVFVSKFCITSSEGIVRIMSVELFPTVIRSAGMGVASMAASTGSILAPIFIELQSYYKPLIIFGSLSILAGLLALLFPETAEKPLPKTLDDIDMS